MKKAAEVVAEPVAPVVKRVKAQTVWLSPRAEMRSKAKATRRTRTTAARKSLARSRRPIAKPKAHSKRK